MAEPEVFSDEAVRPTGPGDVIVYPAAAAARDLSEDDLHGQEARQPVGRDARRCGASPNRVPRRRGDVLCGLGMGVERVLSLGHRGPPERARRSAAAGRDGLDDPGIATPGSPDDKDAACMLPQGEALPEASGALAWPASPPDGSADDRPRAAGRIPALAASVPGHVEPEARDSVVAGGGPADRSEGPLERRARPRSIFPA